MAEKFENPASTADIIAPYQGGFVFIRRKNDPYQGKLALPGGFLDLGKETLEQAASRELEEETNLVVSPETLQLVGVYSNPSRDPRGHVISHAYFARGAVGDLIAKDDAAEVVVLRREEIPKDLAFDHNRILDEYFRRFVDEAV